jgi:hypothetical protein
MAQVDGEQRSSTQVQRMNNLEYLMWLLEADPLLTSQFANLTMLDSVPDIDRLRARLDRAAQIVPACTSGWRRHRRASQHRAGGRTPTSISTITSG